MKKLSPKQLKIARVSGNPLKIEGSDLRKLRRGKLTAASFEIGPGHKGAQKKQKIYNKGKSTDNPFEKETFLKRTGPQLPQVKKRTKKSYA